MQDCPKKQQCFSGTPCKAKEDPSSDNKPGRPHNGASPTPTIWTPLLGAKEDGSLGGSSSSGSIEVDEVTSKFFCGASWGQLVENCEGAKACPSGTNAECEGGQSCFANTPCGKPPKPAEDSSVGIFNFASMVDKIPSYCKDADTMSRNVGYWQSWSIW